MLSEAWLIPCDPTKSLPDSTFFAKGEDRFLWSDIPVAGYVREYTRLYGRTSAVDSGATKDFSTSSCEPTNTAVRWRTAGE